MIDITKAEKAQVKKILSHLHEEFGYSHKMCKEFIHSDEKIYNYHDGRKDGIRIAVGLVKKLLGNEYYKT